MTKSRRRCPHDMIRRPISLCGRSSLGHPSSLASDARSRIDPFLHAGPLVNDRFRGGKEDLRQIRIFVHVRRQQPL